ncbi:hypothetical protein OY671_007979, partial [Metschnikowia pulcherrima]
SKGTEEYRIGEIFSSATDETQQQVRANAEKIVEQIKQGGSFVAYARQFSEASTAAVGGDLGWIRLGQLPNESAAAATGMAPGQLAGPIPIPGGFSILYSIDKRQVSTADPRDAVLSLKQISIAFPKGTTEKQAADKAAGFASMVKSIHGCGEAEKAAATIGASVVANDQIKARDSPGASQETSLKLSVGEATPPFGSIEDGVRVSSSCGRDDPKVDSGPSFDELQQQMEDDRVNKRAQTYSRDSRRDAGTAMTLSLPLAASIGDPAGVGPESFCAAWASSGAEASPPFFVVGSRASLEQAAHRRHEDARWFADEGKGVGVVEAR